MAKISSAKQWANRGLEAFQCGHVAKAKGMFSKATKENPNDFWMRANLARTLRQSGELPQAILEMRQAVEQSNGDPKLRVELGNMYLESGQWLPAKRQAELALQTNHAFAPAWFLNGKVSKAKGDYQSALAALQHAVGITSNQVDVEMEIVNTYQEMGQPLRALSAVEHLLSKHPAQAQPEPALIAKSVILLALEQVEPAVEILETASRYDNASSEVFVRLGQAHVMAGRHSQARMALNRGKQAYPDIPIFEDLIASLKTDNQRVASNQDFQIR